MTVLTWMHCKFRRSETWKEFPLGQVLLDSHIYQKRNNGSEAPRQLHREGQARLSFTTLKTTTLRDLDENASAEFFEGFLAIGTLGTDAVDSEAETPTFAESLEELAEIDDEVTEKELRLINDKDSWTDSSGRNSHVSNVSISHASSITLSGKSLKISEITGTEKTTVRKKEQRTSLGELFEMQSTEEISEAKHKKREKREKCKNNDNTAINLMKKIMKKKIVDTSSRCSPALPETKLGKILHKFQKRLCPECLTSTQKSEKSRKNKIMDMIPCNACYSKARNTVEDVSMKGFFHRAFRNGKGQRNKDGFNQTQLVAHGSDSSGSRECWIKTENYLVLEL